MCNEVWKTSVIQKKLIKYIFKLGFPTVILYQPSIFLTAKISFHFAPMNPDPWCDADCWEGTWMPMMDMFYQQKWKMLRTKKNGLSQENWGQLLF